MFNCVHTAKLREAKLIVRQDKAGERHKSCEVSLHYPFTEKVAANIGGHATVVQEMLANGGGDLQAKLNGGKLILDCKEVRIRMKCAAKGSDQKVEVERTTSITATAKKPNAEDPEPTLAVKAKFDVDGDLMAFIWDNLDSAIKVRMDRRQLELNQDPEPEEAGEEGE